MGNCSGADLDSRGYGSAGLAECLDRLGGVPSLAAPAACASDGAAEYYLSQPSLRQVMSPNSSQTLPQDPFHVHPTQEADACVRTRNSPVKCKEEASMASMPAKEEFDVKEEPEEFGVKEEPESESGGSRNGTPAQASQPSVLENERPHEPEVPVSNRDTQEAFFQVPWNDVLNELRSVQQSCKQLRTQVEGIGSNVDMSHIVGICCEPGSSLEKDLHDRRWCEV